MTIKEAVEKGNRQISEICRLCKDVGLRTFGELRRVQVKYGAISNDQTILLLRLMNGIDLKKEVI